MKVAARYTQIAAYYDHAIPRAQGQYNLILSVMHHGRDYSLSELSLLTGPEKSTLAGRINELRAAGTVETAPKRKCSVTQITITPSRLPVMGQRELWQ